MRADDTDSVLMLAYSIVIVLISAVDMEAWSTMAFDVMRLLPVAVEK